MEDINWGHSRKRRLISGLIGKERIKKRKVEEEEGNGEDGDISDEEALIETLVNGMHEKLQEKLNGKRKGKINHIYFDKDITKESCRDLINEIDEVSTKILKLACDYEMNQPPKIYLHINCQGGNLMPCFAVIDTMRNSKIPIVTIIDSVACSGATLISVFGSERWISKHAYMMIHQLRGAAWGTFEEIKTEFENKKDFMDRIIQIYTDKTRMNKKELQSLLKHDRYWNAEACLEKGLVDKII